MLAIVKRFTMVLIMQRVVMAFTAAIGLFSLNTATLSAAVIPNLFTTGVDSSGVSLAPGAFDPHYVMINRSDSVPPGGNPVVMDGHPWFANSATSMWVWAGQDGRPSPLSVTFRTTFDLSGLDPNSASINGYWIVDNAGIDIKINGVSTGNTMQGGGPPPVGFSINHGFISGVNTLDFIVEDGGVIGGFRVSQISGIASPASSGGQVPEPASISIFGLSVLGFACRRRRKSRV